MQMALQDPGLMFCPLSAEKQLSKYAEWTAPRAGMFLWLKLAQVDDSMDIFEELKAAKVVVVPGDPKCSIFKQNASGLVKYDNAHTHHHGCLPGHNIASWLRLWAITALQSHKVT